MRRLISILTASRAEYGLLRPLIYKLIAIADFDVRVVVTGAHLSTDFGLTYKEIEQDGITIDEKLEILLNSDTPASITKSMGLAMIGFADYFAKLNPDMLIVLGDRYESLAVCCAAMNQQIPIAHLYGGETTEGAVDESIRHSITKMSYLHFTSIEEYRRRVIQLGEDPSRVFCVGALGVENVLNQRCLDKNELEKSLGLSLDQPYAMVTFHPVTLEKNDASVQFKELLKAIKNHKELKFIFSKANADVSGRMINHMIEEYVTNNSHAVAFSSLGTVRYLSSVKHSLMVIGNSSSGLIEVPSLHVPTINIGDRQKGRIQADSVLNCRPLFEEIDHAITLASSEEWQSKSKETCNPYEKGNSSGEIASIIESFLNSNPTITLKKKFYDL